MVRMFFECVRSELVDATHCFFLCCEWLRFVDGIGRRISKKELVIFQRYWEQNRKISHAHTHTAAHVHLK